nr:Fe-Mn family superoxide dismutase [Maliibacterium massiliense]
MAQHYPFAPIPLPYAYDALLPAVTPETLYCHQRQIYAAYVDQLNALLSAYPQYHSMDLETLIAGDLNLPATIAQRISFLAGGIYCHELHFTGMAPAPLEPPAGPLAGAIAGRYGSIDAFKELFFQAAESINGTGFVWLNTDASGDIHIMTSTSYQTPDLHVFTPLFALDTWEHAYFCQWHANLRGYGMRWFDVLDWTQAGRRFIMSRRP